MHAAENDAAVNCTHEKIPMFNAGIYLEDGKTKVGKIEEIFGPIKDIGFSVKMESNMKAKSLDKNTKMFIDPMKLLPLSRFTSMNTTGTVKGEKSPGRGRGGARGGRGGSRGCRGGFSRGGGR